MAGVRTGVAGVPCDGRRAAVGLRGKDLPILGRRGVCVCVCDVFVMCNVCVM